EILPGEQATIKLVQRGSSQSQAVGYLDDGTMVVVNNSVKLIGKTVRVEISRSLQTAAGKMLFAEIINDK
ncbi:MAG TPA: TRAM domain-containing protein, partial [Candidatus Dormibacteraeota bacterium]|nr:TRAM domain-containing protein [Candidatus Dormibacteraeota bacterium]